MIGGVIVAARSHGAARRLRNIAAAATTLALTFAGGAAAAQTGSAPLIKIPPAQLSPPASKTATKPTAASIQPAARGVLPTRVQILRDERGSGIALYGALTGKPASASGVILAVFANSQAFDPTPVIKLMAAEEDDRRAQALFTASVQGTQVIGVAVAALSDTGGDVTLFYDAADAFAASFPRMREALAQSDGVGTVELSPLRLGDDKTVSIPAGWEATTQGVGSVTLQGRQGEVVSLGATMPVHTAPSGSSAHVLQAPCCDPADAFAALYPQIAAVPRPGVPPQEPGTIAESQPVATSGAGHKAALVLSNLRVGGDDYSYLALAETVAGFTDPWTFNLSGVMAPQPVFAEELPTLLRIWKSYDGERSGLSDAAQQALSGMNGISALLKASITVRETSAYNAARGWERLVAASHGTTNDSLMRPLLLDLSAETGRQWRIVPAAEWK